MYRPKRSWGLGAEPPAKNLVFVGMYYYKKLYDFSIGFVQNIAKKSKNFLNKGGFIKSFFKKVKNFLNMGGLLKGVVYFLPSRSQTPINGSGKRILLTKLHLPKPR